MPKLPKHLQQINKNKAQISNSKPNVESPLVKTSKGDLEEENVLDNLYNKVNLLDPLKEEIEGKIKTLQNDDKRVQKIFTKLDGIDVSLNEIQKHSIEQIEEILTPLDSKSDVSSTKKTNENEVLKEQKNKENKMLNNNKGLTK